MRKNFILVQVLVRALPGWVEVESDAVAFVVMGEDRLLMDLEAPEGTQAQPLTLAAMQVILQSCMCSTRDPFLVDSFKPQPS